MYRLTNWLFAVLDDAGNADNDDQGAESLGSGAVVIAAKDEHEDAKEDRKHGQEDVGEVLIHASSIALRIDGLKRAIFRYWLSCWILLL